MQNKRLQSCFGPKKYKLAFWKILWGQKNADWPSTKLILTKKMQIGFLQSWIHPKKCKSGSCKVDLSQKNTNWPKTKCFWLKKLRERNLWNEGITRFEMERSMETMLSEGEFMDTILPTNARACQRAMGGLGYQ